jgi:hypothetical protein
MTKRKRTKEQTNTNTTQKAKDPATRTSLIPGVNPDAPEL